MIDTESLDALEAKITGTWPLKSEAAAWKQAAKWRAFREADAETIKPRDWETDRAYVVDPLAGRISGAFSDLVFGEDPKIEPADEADADRLAEIVTENEVGAGLQEAGDICSSEGDVWGRIYRDESVASCPLLDWYGRESVVPLFVGGKLKAVAFHSTIRDGDMSSQVYRVFEMHAQGIVRTRLYRGSTQSVGTMVSLDSRPETMDVEEEWRHDLPMLAFRVANRTRKRQSGISDYAGVKSLLYALNEAVSIGAENARLTLKQRVAVPQRMLDPTTGKFPVGREIIVSQNVDADPDKPEGMAQIEWSFDAAAWSTWHDKLTNIILTRCRVAPQLVGQQTGNAPESGTALRSRLLDSVMAANGKGRPWDATLPKAFMLLQMVDSLPVERGGFGNSWTAPELPPSVERESALPEDDRDESERIVMEVEAEILSRQTAIEEKHPDWSEERVIEELRRLDDEAPKLPPLIGATDPHAGSNEDPLAA